MPAIFKKIRRKLAEENKVTGYLRYALGEILLVVIGILIALQVNNWNEVRKTRASEQVILKSLLKEFQDNQTVLEESVQVNLDNIAAARKIGEYTGPHLQQADEKELSMLMVWAFKKMPDYLPSLGSLFEVINSGKLSIISNQDLRSELSSYESVLDNVHAQEKYVSEQEDKAHQFFLKEGNFRRHLDIIDDPLVDVSPSRFPNNDFKFLENPQFESYLYLYIVASANLDKHFYASLKAKQDSIIRLIESEIK